MKSAPPMRTYGAVQESDLASNAAEVSCPSLPCTPLELERRFSDRNRLGSDYAWKPDLSARKPDPFLWECRDMV